MNRIVSQFACDTMCFEKRIHMNNRTIRSIGIPNAMLYHRYRVLWTRFFTELGFQLVISEPTNRSIMESGESRSIDESCLAAKIFLGHVESLIGRCDCILIPRYSNFGRQRNMCTRFEAMYDLTRNSFRNSGQQYLGFDVDVLKHRDEETELVRLASELGCSAKSARAAYKAARREETLQYKAAVKAQEALYQSDRIKVLIAAHRYIIEDAYIGKPVVDFLRRADVVPIAADIVDRDAALKRSLELSPTCKWELSRELVGSIAMHAKQVDGIILMSTFPCGPDSMVNELLMRRVKDVPMLNLVLDGQSGTAGVETRLESFIDIIRFKEGRL